MKTVEGYITNAPAHIQDKLRQLRALIKEIAPDAKERISYGMPFYEYKGRLVYFGLSTNHLGLYIPPPIIERHAKELMGYGTTKSAVHLPLDKDLPKSLIRNLITARMKWNRRMQRVPSQ